MRKKLDWIVKPRNVSKDNPWPVLNIPYGFDMPEKEFAEYVITHIKEIRKRYKLAKIYQTNSSTIKNPRRHAKIGKDKYEQVLKARKEKLMALNKYLRHESTRSILRGSYLPYAPERKKGQHKSTYKKQIVKYKAPLNKLNIIKVELAELEKDDPFGYREFKTHKSFPNPYRLSLATLRKYLKQFKK